MQMYPINPTVRIESGGFVRLRRDWHDRGVLIDSSKLFYITDGEIVIRADGKETVCREGDMVLIPSGVKHDYFLSESGAATKYWFHFSLTSNAVSVFENFDMPLRFAVDAADRDAITELFARVLERSEGYSVYLCRIGAVCELVSYYVEHSGAVERYSIRDGMEEIIKYIGEHLSEDMMLSDLASRACLSPNYFVRKFGDVTGMSPLKYVAYARMERAKQLLSATTMSVADIMTSVGFSDSAHFSKAFKRHTGYSPTLYRRVTGGNHSKS